MTAQSDSEQLTHRFEPIPLWVLQMRILLLLYTILDDDTDAMKSELDKTGSFMTVRTSPFVQVQSCEPS